MHGQAQCTDTIRRYAQSLAEPNASRRFASSRDRRDRPVSLPFRPPSLHFSLCIDTACVDIVESFLNEAIELRLAARAFLDKSGYDPRPASFAGTGQMVDKGKDVITDARGNYIAHMLNVSFVYK
jgi:hypothetical protein